MSSPFFPYGARAGPDDVHGSVAPPPFAEVASADVDPAAAVDVLQHCADGGEADQPRSTADDERIAIHEASHATVGRLLGQSLCGVTCDAGDGFSGRCWGPEYESRFANGGDS